MLISSHSKDGWRRDGRRDRTPRRPGLGFVAIAALVPSVLVATPGQAAGQGAPDVIVPLRPPSVFVPLTPTRVATQVGDPSSFSPFGEQVSLSAHVPAGATAVAVNFSTLAGGDFPGSGVFACGWWFKGECKSEFSSFDGFPTGWRSASQFTTLAISDERTMTMASTLGTTAVADLLGYYVPARVTPTGGRFKALTPSRVLDTRDNGAMVDNSSITIDLTSRLPADAAAAVVTVTVVDLQRDGFVTTHRAGSIPPEVSNLLVVGSQRTVSNQAIVELQNRAFTVLQTGRSHLLVDLVGYYTANSAAPGNDGLFVPLRRSTLYNSFQPDGLPWNPPPGGDSFYWPPPYPEAAGSTITVTFTPPIFGPPISAMLLRINGQFSAPGFVNVWPSGTQPWTTDLFADTPDAPRSAAATTGVDNSTFRVYTSSAGSLNIDTNGYFTGSV